MSKLLWIAITSLLWCLPFTLARADGPPTADGRAAALVKQLQDRSFKVRERASRELINMGPAAVPALRRGCKDADPEVRRRCQAILPLALKRDQDRLLKQLLADNDGSAHYDLPGWRRYRQLVGKDRTARQLYADMLRAHGDLVAAAAHDPGSAVRPLRSLVDRLIAMNAVSAADLATLAFTTATLQVADHGLPYDSICNVLENRFSTLSDTPATKKCLRPLLSAVVKRCIHAGQLQPALKMSVALDLKESADLAVKILKDKSAGTSERALAAYVLGKIGRKEQLPILTTLLKDRTSFASFSTGGVNGKTEVGDVALASLVRLTGQDLHSYNFPAADLDEASLRIHAAAILGFPSDAVRAAAKAKWKAWAEKNLPH